MTKAHALFPTERSYLKPQNEHLNGQKNASQDTTPGCTRNLKAPLSNIQLSFFAALCVMSVTRRTLPSLCL